MAASGRSVLDAFPTECRISASDIEKNGRRRTSWQDPSYIHCSIPADIPLELFLAAR
jgi:hypothetical protein